jgi:hypothetical protein
MSALFTATDVQQSASPLLSELKFSESTAALLIARRAMEGK